MKWEKKKKKSQGDLKFPGLFQCRACFRVIRFCARSNNEEEKSFAS